MTRRASFRHGAGIGKSAVERTLTSCQAGAHTFGPLGRGSLARVARAKEISAEAEAMRQADDGRPAGVPSLPRVRWLEGDGP